MKIQSLKPVIVEFVPEELEEGIIYYSPEFSTATHLCACGCKERTVTPINKDMWRLEIISDKVTLSPSIGNFHIPCKSHYWITEGKVIEC